jgi:hypothetical protein
MSGYTLLRDSYSVTIREGTAFDDENAKGEANLVFYKDAGGSASLPTIGDNLYDPDYYYTGSSATVYTNIRVKEVKQTPFGIKYPTSGDSGDELWKYTVRYDADGSEDGEIIDFNASLEIVSMEDPTNWRYGTDFVDADPPVNVNNIQGSTQQRISKVVVVGSFKQRKIVDATKVETFFDDYKKVAGKTNEIQVLVPIYEDGGGSYYITFEQGQLLVGALDSGEKVENNKYVFDVVYQYRFIGDKNAPRTEWVSGAPSGSASENNDWQWVLAPITGADSDAGWMIPVQTTGGSGDGGTVLTDEPFLYRYTDGMQDFLEDSYYDSV